MIGRNRVKNDKIDSNSSAVNLYDRINANVVSSGVFNDLVVEGYNPWWHSLWVEKSSYKSDFLASYRNELYVAPGAASLKKAKNETTNLVNSEPDQTKPPEVYTQAVAGTSRKDRTSTVGIIDFLKGIKFLSNFVIKRTVSIFGREYGASDHAKGEKGLGPYLIVTYFPNLDMDLAEKGIFRSNYWGPLADVLSDHRVPAIWLLLWVPGLTDMNFPRLKELVEKINRTNRRKGIQQKLVFLEDYCDRFTLFSILKEYLRIWLYFSKSRRIEDCFRDVGGRRLLVLAERDLRSSCGGSVAAEGVLFRNLFRNLSIALPSTIKKVFYLMENQGWERALIHNLRRYKKGVEIYGVVHSRVSTSDLRYRRLESIKHCLPEPDYVISNGGNATRNLIDSGYSDQQVIECEALRYLYVRGQTVADNIGIDTETSRLLVVTDIRRDVTTGMLEILHGLLKARESLQIVIKPHPLCRNFNSIPDFDEKRVTWSDRRLDDLFREIDIVFSSGLSTSSVEAAYSGKRLIEYVPEDSHEEAAVGADTGARIVTNLAEMETALEEAAPVNIHGYFNIDESLPSWRTVFDIQVA